MVEIRKKYLDSFINGINKDFKWDYDPFYLDSDYDMDGFSFLYYYNYIIKRSNRVIDEIKENLLFIGAEKHLSYLNYVQERIKRDVVTNVDSSFLNKWIEKYDTNNLEFPFLQNPDLKKILSIAVDEYEGYVPIEDQLTIQIQKDFYFYAFYLEKNKIIDFIKSLVVEISYKAIEETQEIKDEKVFVPEEEIAVNDESNSEPEKPVNPYQRIFTSYYAFSFFEKLLAEFGIEKNKLSNYSFVYHKMVKDKLIYHDIKQIEYFDLLAIYDIHISRIKGLNDMGNTELRESIYASVKESHKIVT